MKSKHQGLRIMIPAALACVVISAVYAFGRVTGAPGVVLQLMFWLAFLFGGVGLFLHYREMWRMLTGPSTSSSQTTGSTSSTRDRTT